MTVAVLYMYGAEVLFRDVPNMWVSRKYYALY